MRVNGCTISAPTFIAARMRIPVLDAAWIIIRFYYRLTIERDASALDRKAPWQTRLRVWKREYTAAVYRLFRSSLYTPRKKRLLEIAAGYCAAIRGNGCNKFHPDERRFHYRDVVARITCNVGLPSKICAPIDVLCDATCITGFPKSMTWMRVLIRAQFLQMHNRQLQNEFSQEINCQ